MERRQSGLFGSDRPAVRKNDPATSRDAYFEEVRPTLAERQIAVYNDVYRFGRHGSTSFETAQRMRVERDSISSRFSELERKNLLFRKRDEAGRLVGRRRTGATSGKGSTVWIAAPFANDVERDFGPRPKKGERS